LRELLGDQLLYRQGNQLLLTPFAERLGPTLRRLLGELNGLTSQEGLPLPTGRGAEPGDAGEQHDLAHGGRTGSVAAGRRG
jgi:DNA-binding transcriptional LysR family regulator